MEEKENNKRDSDFPDQCIACREPIRVGATVCPHCGTPQKHGRLKAFGDFVKWIGGALAVISLLTGVLSLNGLYSDWRDKQEAVAEIVIAAQWLLETKGYQQSWDLYQQALELSPGSSTARSGQIELAMLWLRNIRVLGDKETFTSIVDRLLPILHRGLATADNKRSATLLAHVGWAYYLKHRDIKAYKAEVNTAFQRALEFDPLNGYANAMYGYWLISYEDNLDDGVASFERALKTDIDRLWIRRLQMNSLAEESYRLYRRKPEILVRYMDVLLRTANEMRKNNEPLPAERTRYNIIRNYGPSYSAGNVEILVPLLPPKDYLETVIWLLAGEDKTESFKTKLQTRYLIARLTEETGDKDSALTQYYEIFRAKSGRESFNILVDAAIERIAGKPTERALLRAGRHYLNDALGEKDNPWEFHRDSLLYVPPVSSSENLAQAINYFISNLTGRLAQEQADKAVLIFIQSRDRLRRWVTEKTKFVQMYDYSGVYSKGSETLAYNNLYSVWKGIGYLAIAAGQYDKAVAELNDLINRLEDDDEQRFDAWYQLARAYSLRAAKLSDKVEQKEDILQAIKYLTTTINSGAIDRGVFDWESIKTSSDWQAIRFTSEYQSLVRGR